MSESAGGASNGTASLPRTDGTSGDGRIQVFALTVFLAVYFMPTLLLACAMILSHGGGDPSAFDRAVFWIVANQEKILGSVYKLAIACLGVAMPFVMKDLSLSAFRALVTSMLFLVIVAAALDSSFDITTVKDAINVGTVFGSDVETVTVGLVANIRNYLSQVQQITLFVLSTLLGLRLSK